MGALCVGGDKHGLPIRLVIEDGRIVGCGTHAGLLARGGVYRALYEAQFEAGRA